MNRELGVYSCRTDFVNGIPGEICAKGALDTLFSVHLKGNLIVCALLLLYGCDKNFQSN